MARKISFSHEVKNELARFFVEDEEILQTELSAMFGVLALNIESRIDFFNSNAAVARKVVAITKKIFPNAKIEVAAVRSKNLCKTIKYVVRIFFTSQTENFFNDLFSEISSKKILDYPNLGVAYLRGAFLASGSVNRPEKNYNLEIICATKLSAEFVQKIFKVFDMNANLYERKGFFVVYIKEGDSICDFLGIIGAEKAVDRFEIAQNIKEVRAMVNRIVNCETANLNKAVDAAQRQIADIRKIIAKKIKVKDHIARTMKMRLKYPEDSAVELAKKLFLSKQGVLYRFRVIHKLAED